jgi:hypothetical protein
MPNRTRTLSNRWTTDPSVIPLPHPSWRGDVPLVDLAQPLLAAEFWKRLGL